MLYYVVIFRDRDGHVYERGTASGSLFRRQLYEKGLLTKEEYEELGRLEDQMNVVHPIVDGVIFLGT